jgi:hypothetical protein
MGVVSMFLASQQKAIVQGEALVHELSAQGYASIRVLLARYSRFLPEVWAAEMKQACADAREAWTDRELADGDWENNNSDVRELVEEGNAWRAEASSALNYAKSAGIPGVEAALKELAGIGVAVDSYEQQRCELPLLVRRMERLNMADLDLPPEFVQRGLELANKMAAERADADAAKGERVVETSVLGRAILRIAALAEQLYAARALTAIRSRQELPGFDLTYIRAAAAAHSEPAEEPTEPTPADLKKDGSGL